MRGSVAKGRACFLGGANFYACTLFFNIAWDNLRIDVFGFTAFCESFLDRYPGYYLVPLRMSGSAVETLFGQYKYLSGNKLDSVNYTTARAKCMCKSAVDAGHVHHSGKYYRDMPLFLSSVQLTKKNYRKATS